MQWNVDYIKDLITKWIDPRFCKQNSVLCTKEDRNNYILVQLVLYGLLGGIGTKMSLWYFDTYLCCLIIYMCNLQSCGFIYSALEVAVAGRKQGVTKKKKGNNLLTSRRMLLRTFLQILDKYQNHYSEIRHPKKITYYDWKQWSTIYQNKSKQLKLGTLHNWPCKPINLQNFIL